MMHKKGQSTCCAAGEFKRKLIRNSNKTSQMAGNNQFL